MADPILRCLMASLEADRSAFRRARSRLIFAEGTLLHALADWQMADDPEDRAFYRHFGRRQIVIVRKRRVALRAVTRCLEASHEAYLTEVAERRGIIRRAA